jgi:NADPH2 dehydrogenase
MRSPKLFSEFTLKGHKIKNRIVFTPAVCFGYAGEDGTATDKNILHYRLRADNGAGIIITEATSVRPDGKAAERQLGLWSDEHIDGLTRISDVVRKSGSLSLIQLHHAGLVAPVQVNKYPVGPSSDPKNPDSRELALNEVRNLRDVFIDAGIRAQKAGFDGVELHGAHGYLLNQFASSAINNRNDEYGKDFSGRMKLAGEIITGIRQKCGEDFIIGYRLGANSPTLEDGIEISKHLERAGIDYLHVSHAGNLQNLPRPPKDFEFNWIVFSGVTIKQHVKLPVIVVNEIKTAERASLIIEKEMADFVAIGRPMLADPSWVSHTRNNEPVNICSSCRPKCKWYEDSGLCPAFQRIRPDYSELA